MLSLLPLKKIFSFDEHNDATRKKTKTARLKRKKSFRKGPMVVFTVDDVLGLENKNTAGVPVAAAAAADVPLYFSLYAAAYLSYTSAYHRFDIVVKTRADAQERKHTTTQHGHAHVDEAKKE